MPVYHAQYFGYWYPEWLRWKIERNARGAYRQLYSKRKHSRLLEERRDGGTYSPCFLKPQKPVTQQPGLINTYTIT
jgi:hypothetical protein